MHVISRRRLIEAGERHSDLVAPLDIWYRYLVSRHQGCAWQNLMEVRQQMPTADAVAQFVVFNIKGNRYRLITEIFFKEQVLLVRHVLTHAEYDKGGWK